MQKSAIAKTIHGYFLASEHKVARGDDSDSESEEETDEDDFNVELGNQNLSCDSSERISVNSVRLKKTIGKVLLPAFTF